MYNRNLKQKGSEKGQNLVEFAILLPFLIIVLFGALDLGRIFWVSISLTNAAREGARYISLHPDDITGTEMRTHITVNSDLDIEDDNIPDPVCSIEDGKCKSGTSARVTVTYKFDLILGWILPSPIELSRSVEMMVQ